MRETNGGPTTARVGALFLYPVKSAAGLAVTSIELDGRGPVGDRRLMVVDPAGRFITQRECHRLATMRPSFATTDRAGDLLLDAPGMPRLCVAPHAGGEAFTHASTRRSTHDSPHASAHAHSHAGAAGTGGESAVRSAEIWGDIVPVDDCGDNAAEWVSDALGVRSRLVRIADSARRPLAPRFAGPLPHAARDVTLSDGAPLLLLGAASIAALNDRLAAVAEPPMTVERFRPSVLLEGTSAHEEDTWRLVRIGDLEIGVGSQCPRCVITTIDQTSLAQGVEPLRTLAGYRRVDGGVVFGMNATHAQPGRLLVGQSVEVVQRR